METLVPLKELKILHIPYRLLLRTELPPMTELQELTITHYHDDLQSSSTPDRTDMVQLSVILAQCHQLRRIIFDLDEKSTVRLNGLVFPSDGVLQEIHFGGTMNMSLNGITFGETVIKLSLAGRFNQSLVDADFPHSLRVLQFNSYSFNQPLDQVKLPPWLETLEFTSGFDQPLQQVELPSTLKRLNLGDRYNRSLHGVTLPPSLELFGFGTPYWSSAFKSIDSLITLDLPLDSLHTLILPHPRSTGLGFREDLDEYAQWLTKLKQSHPYLVLRLNGIS